MLLLAGGHLHVLLEIPGCISHVSREEDQIKLKTLENVLDPFAGGGAIPLEAMRLGCEVTAIDINPVAWFILKCTLEYPQKLAGQKRPLPEFVRPSRQFMESYFKAQGYKNSTLEEKLKEYGLGGEQAPQLGLIEMDAALPDADLAWHVRAWGWWVLQRAKADLERFYPTIDGKPTVAYLWARTVTCKHCRATLPLLKTRWLCKKDKKRVVLTMQPNAEKTGVVFGIQNLSQERSDGTPKKATEKDLGKGIMSRSGATCPCCNSIMTKEDIQQEGLRGHIGNVITAVVVDSENGKEYRVATPEEINLAAQAKEEIDSLFASLPFGLPHEAITADAKGNTWCVLYGIDTFEKLFTARQLFALGILLKHMQDSRIEMQQELYGKEWLEAISAYLALSFDRFVSFNCMNVRWKLDAEAVVDAFARFALPVLWDYTESIPINNYAGAYSLCYERIASALDVMLAASLFESPSVINQSATSEPTNWSFDAIVTDPPYYSAIGYSVIMDFFYVWLRRTLHGLSPEIDQAFSAPLAPKWDHDKNDGELIDDASRFGGDKAKSKANYEEGMARAFQACYQALAPDGRLVIVFAHKQPDAWETLVSAIIRAGFVVDGSWPIQTEMGNRTRALTSAALSSSVWMVCKKRPEVTRPGWDNRVLEEMREKITTRLRDFWDDGIRGPDFVWAATGPAMEAYSQYPIVKKANEPGQVMSVSEFLRHVRRMVVDFVVGRVLTHDGEAEDVTGLDDLTTYYLLHRHDFGLEETPVGPCILYAVSCGLSDSALVDRYDLLVRTGGQSTPEEEEGEEEASSEAEAPEESGSGSKVKLKPWHQRKRAGMGVDDGRPIPLIDQTHRLMSLWRAGDVTEVDKYLDARGLRHNALFHHLLQSLIELAPAGSEERSLLESISNHLAAQQRVRAIPASVSLWKAGEKEGEE